MTEVTISRAGTPKLVRLGKYLVDFELLFHMYDVVTVTDTEAVITTAAVTQLYNTSGQQCEIISTDNAQDKAAGTGLLTARFYYVNTDDEICYEIMTLNGTTGVATTATDIKAVLPFYMETVGSGKDPVGAITIENTANDTDYVAMAAGDENLFLGTLYCPAGYIGYYILEASYVAGADDQGIEVHQYLSDGATNEVLQPIQRQVAVTETNGQTVQLIMEGILFSNKLNIFKTKRLGNANQTVTFSMRFGFRRL